jgi:hypothetical protein
MPVVPKLDRIGWPHGAVERIECANCGRQHYMETRAPNRATDNYDLWINTAWSFGRSMQTRVGFVLWCSAYCEAAWKQANERRIALTHAPTTGENIHRREIERRARASGEYVR